MNIRFTLLILILSFSFSCSKSSTTPSGTNPDNDDDDVVVTIPDADTWWNDRVFYEIFVRSFYDSNGDGIGDINGIRQKLDYLNDGDPNTTDDLGVTGIWLMPIFPSPSYHGYDVTDYEDVHPDYGTLNDLRALISEAHSRGIAVIIDFVGNHTSTQHPWFEASASGQSKRDWYRWVSSKPSYLGPWGQEVWHQNGNSFYYGVFWGGMPDLNYANSEVTDEIKRIVTFWSENVGVDGFRIDAVKHWIENNSQQENTSQTLSWWRDFYAFQKNISPGLLTVGEVWTSTQNVAPYSDQRLDFCFEFDLAYSIINALKNGSVSSLESKIEEIENTYNPSQFGSFLTNHDQDRIFSELGQNIPKSKLAASILMTLPGVPFLYYGEEVGMIGQKPDENIRRPMQWNSGANGGFSTGSPWYGLNSNYVQYNVESMDLDDASLLKHYKKWIGYRNLNIALRQGDYQTLDLNLGAALGFLRSTSDQKLIVVHNFSSSAANTVTISASQSSLTAGTYAIRIPESEDVIGNLTVESDGGFSITIDTIEIPAYGSQLFMIE